MMGVQHHRFQENKEKTRMNQTGPDNVARSLLPLLVTLMSARKQAHWQWRNCADEHKHRWTAVIGILDKRLLKLERRIASTLGLRAFRAKRVLDK